MIDIGQLDILSLVIFAPLVGAIVLAFIPGDRVAAIRWGALTIAAVAFVLSIVLVLAFDPSAEGFQFVQQVPWIGFFGIEYKVGVDGISLVLVLLTTLLTTISILASFGPITTRVKEYMIAFLVLEVGMLGVFLALDLFLFYIFWEIVLVPMYLIIGIWGGANRIYATIKFVLYTLVGSLLMLIAILALAWTYQSTTGTWVGAFDYETLVAFGFDPTLQLWAFLGFFLAFAIKVPMWPFHTWLPDAHTEAPTAGSVILAGVLLKLGGYGLIRYSLPLFPNAAHDLAWLVIALSVIGMIYGAIVAVRQPDLKRLIAYSSVSHMGFVTLGIFLFSQQGLQGAVFQMVAHGVITGALFLLVGVIYERTHDRTIANMGGLGSRLPVFATLLVFFSLASAGLPALAGFVGEFLVLVAAVDFEPLLGYIAAFTIIFAGVYLLFMLQNVVFGDLSDFLKRLGDRLTDVQPVEVATLAPLVVLAVAFGIFPALILDLITAPIDTVLAVVDQGIATGPAAMTQNEWLAIAPFIFVVGLALLVVIVDVVRPHRDDLVMGVSLVGLGIALALTLVAGPLPGAGILPAEGQVVFGGLYVQDMATTLLDALVISIGILTVLFAPDYLVPRRLPMAEFCATLLFAISGAMLLAGGQDLLILFVGLELLVLPGYILAGFAKRDGLSTEGAIKYFLLGSFSSAILLFGLAFFFGYTGSTQVSAISDALTDLLANASTFPLALAMGLALLAVGVLFKIAAVPFHYWTPDAYQGSPTPVTGYLSVGPKVAAFALILRLFVEALAPLADEWVLVVILVSVVTMTVGNLAALGQDNIKRMLAYSSIAHTGYILVGLAVFASADDPATRAAGIQGVLFYSVAYAFMNLGAFACVAALQRRPGVTSQIATFSGLGYRSPLLALAMTLFLLSLTGIPPLAGFFAKAVIVLGALQVGGEMTIVAVILMLNAAAAAFYYLRVVVYMYMRQPAENAGEVSVGNATRAGLILAAIATVAIGLAPLITGAVLDWTEAAAVALVGI